ncbi:MAG: carboxypeptidase regulatory-like domain-containing protein [Blastocatellia bacterium]
MKQLAMPLAALLFISAFAQEAQPKREGVISGRVVADDGQPMGGAQVIAAGAGQSPLTIVSQMTNCDADGNFKLTGLSHGVYSLVARAPGYISVQDQPRKYRIGESAMIRMVRGGVITGRVTDEFGEPMVGVRVSAERARDSEGKPDKSAPTMSEMHSSRMTDDRGIYRIYGLEAGAYVVGVNSASLMFGGLGQTSYETPTYHPSSPRGAAIEINLRGAEEVAGVDIRARGERGRSISGTIAGETEGEGLISSLVVTLVGAADKRLAGITTLIGARNFSLRGVEDGEYELIATRFSLSMDFALSAPRRVVVRGADLSGIELKLMKLGSVSGRVVIEAPKAECKTALDQFKLEETLIELKRDDKTPSLFASEFFPAEFGGLLGGATPDKEGGFIAKNLEAGRYRIGADLPDENWYIRAITQAASPKPVDISRAGVALKQGEKISGIEMIIAQGAASLSGKVVPSREGAAPPKRLRVHLIPADTAAADDLLRYAEAPVQGDGSFEFKHIAPGKYLLRARQASEKEANDDQARPLAWDAVERAKLRREAAAAKNEIELKVCGRVKEHVLRW